MIQGLKDSNMSKMVGAHDKVSRESFVGSSCRLWKNTHGHIFFGAYSFWKTFTDSFLGEIWTFFLPHTLWFITSLSRLSSTNAVITHCQPNGIKPPGSLGLWANTREQWLVSPAAKGTWCFNNARECFCEVLLPRTFPSGPGPSQLMVWACLSWNTMTSRPSSWPPPLQDSPKPCARTMQHANQLVSKEHEEHALAQTVDPCPRAGWVSAGCRHTIPLQSLLHNIRNVLLKIRLAA